MITTAFDLDGNSVVTLLTIDFSTCVAWSTPPTGTTLLRCSANRNGTANIVYDGNTYSYIGFDVNGLNSEINGGAPSPTITFDRTSFTTNSVYGNLYTQQVVQGKGYYFDPRGAKISIVRTINLDTGQQLTTQEYIVSQANRETQSTIEWQLAVGLGIDNAQSESITTLALNRCSLRYRRWNSTTASFDYTPEEDGGCPYGNPTTVSDWSAVPDFGNKYFTAADAALAPANKNLDKCSYSAKGCQLRFDPAETGLALPFVMLYSPNTLGRK